MLSNYKQHPESQTTLHTISVQGSTSQQIQDITYYTQ